MTTIFAKCKVYLKFRENIISAMCASCYASLFESFLDVVILCKIKYEFCIDEIERSEEEFSLSGLVSFLFVFLNCAHTQTSREWEKVEWNK